MFRKPTFCPKLWNEIFINKDGGVFSCCHKKPRIIGSIYQEGLDVLCNNQVIQNLRRESLSGKLSCYGGCSLLPKDKSFSLKTSSEIGYKDLRRLKISFGDMCNISCVMCHRSNTGTESLDFDKVKEQVDLSPFNSIEIQGGEPLFIEAARKFFDYASSMDKKVSFLTNGLLIDDEWSKKIASHSAFIYFSLNAATKETHESINRGSKWELVLENIQRVRRARSALNTPVKIMGHMTIIPRNLSEIALFIRMFQEFGFDSINFGYDIRVPLYLKLHSSKKKEVSLEVREALEKSRVLSLVDSYRLKLLGLI